MNIKLSLIWDTYFILSFFLASVIIAYSYLWDVLYLAVCYMISDIFDYPETWVIFIIENIELEKETDHDKQSLFYFAVTPKFHKRIVGPIIILCKIII